MVLEYGKTSLAIFYTICDKNQLLNKNIEKVTAILNLVPRSCCDVSCCQVARAENPVDVPRSGCSLEFIINA
jgi:hypothetical protein